MIVLGIDTSTETASVGIVSSHGIEAEGIVRSVRSHQERLMPLVEDTITRAGITLDDIEVLACGTGPGSFTGLRVGISTAQGLALGTGKPLAGVPTMDALVRNVPSPSHPVCAILDAGRDEVYAALYRPVRTQSTREHHQPSELQVEKVLAETVLHPEKLLFRIRGTTIFIGSGLERHGELICKRLGGRARIAPRTLWAPRGSTVAELARARLRAGKRPTRGQLKPLYVRRPDAEEKWDQRRKRK